MTAPGSTSVVIGLSAVVVAIRDGEAVVLTVRPHDAVTDVASPLPGLPFGPFDPEPSHLRAGPAGLRHRADPLPAGLCRAALHLRRQGPRRAARRGRGRRGADGLGRLSGPDPQGRRHRRPRHRLGALDGLLPLGGLARRPPRPARRGHRPRAAPLGRRRYRQMVSRPPGLRPGRRALERGTGAGALRVALRGRLGPRGRARPRPRRRPRSGRARSPVGRLGRADDLGPPAHPGHGTLAPARQDQVPARGVRADARPSSPCRPCSARSRPSPACRCTSRTSAAWSSARTWSRAWVARTPTPAAARPSCSASAARCWPPAGDGPEPAAAAGLSAQNDLGLESCPA
jgi:hypothetical protein